ncbi:hypothetical protein [Phaeobacter sp. J2-8]|uniref:hypothetical protein n=1 Tax=Phaeobacter sp. J2-8 TaxID=2931394 RepID=UPI001FD2850E|nr:hypothetical protein [Phaeobacter sp. J2-8]MCJ7872421.1 hypothetical protein [Phaeobacter sp. J2-8]
MRRILPIALTCAMPFAAWANDPDAAWQLLNTAEFKEIITGDSWRVEKTIPDPLRAAAKDFEITGFFVPVIAQGEIREFLLVEDPADCPFCGNGGYGPVLEVMAKRALPDLTEFAEITLRGQLEFNESPETLQLFRLSDAVLVE